MKCSVHCVHTLTMSCNSNTLTFAIMWNVKNQHFSTSQIKWQIWRVYMSRSKVKNNQSRDRNYLELCLVLHDWLELVNNYVDVQVVLYRGYVFRIVSVFTLVCT